MAGDRSAVGIPGNTLEAAPVRALGQLNFSWLGTIGGWLDGERPASLSHGAARPLDPSRDARLARRWAVNSAGFCRRTR